ncbi:MAG: cupredoxin domain-containing protein [Actinomycetota bacterium]|nr:cupredoxin domain-containing protein [Actinomycetota bacterium]
MSRETRERLHLPVGIPLAALAIIGVVVFLMSRILLAVEPAWAVGIALAMALNVLVGCALLASFPRLSTRILAAVIVLGLGFLGVAGGVAIAVGERPIEPHHVAAPHEEPTEYPGAPADAAEITAPPGAITEGFDRQQLTLPANAEATITFHNEDPGVPHNVAIYTDETAAEAVFTGDIVTGEDTIDYTFEAPDRGQYFFRCDVHPTTMTGQVGFQ